MGQEQKEAVQAARRAIEKRARSEAERSRLMLLEELERACGERPRNSDQKLQTTLARSQKELSVAPALSRRRSTP